jgi:hypothetical protein
MSSAPGGTSHGTDREKCLVGYGAASRALDGPPLGINADSVSANRNRNDRLRTRDLLEVAQRLAGPIARKVS